MDETTLRKAIERVAAELRGDDGAGELAWRAHGLAWAEPSPPPADVEELVERARREIAG